MLALALIVGTLVPAPAPTPTGAEVIAWMRARNTAWPETITFVQETQFPDGRRETWYESLGWGMLRIDVPPLDSGNAIIFRNDSQYVARNHALVRARPQPHPLLLLLYQLRRDPAARTVERLAGLGFDLAVTHETTWEGRPVIVVGAAAGDTLANQFWVDTERLVPVRILWGPADRPTEFTEFHIGGWREVVPGHWMESDVLALRDGRELVREIYTQVRTDAALTRAAFEPGSTLPDWIAAFQ